jgi:hypothetical protein
LKSALHRSPAGTPHAADRLPSGDGSLTESAVSTQSHFDGSVAFVGRFTLFATIWPSQMTGTTRNGTASERPFPISRPLAGRLRLHLASSCLRIRLPTFILADAFRHSEDAWVRVLCGLPFVGPTGHAFDWKPRPPASWPFS